MSQSKLLKKEDLHNIRRWVDRVRKTPHGKAPEGGPKLSYPKIASGKHRRVYDLGNGYVLKLPRLAKGIVCNEIEAELYRHAPSELRKHLCPVVEAGDGWIVMLELGKPLPESEKYKKKTEQVLKKGRHAGVRITDVLIKRGGGRQPKRGNVRMDAKKRVVLIDYANARDAARGRTLTSPSRTRRALGKSGSARKRGRRKGH